MLKFSASDKIFAKQGKIGKIDPLLQFEKHMRTKKIFSKSSSVKIHPRYSKVYASESPQMKLADKFLIGLNFLCESTQRTLQSTRNKVISLKIKTKQPEIFEEPKFHFGNDAIISQCQEFVNDRKFSLKTQKELVFTKRLQKSVTKKLVG